MIQVSASKIDTFDQDDLNKTIEKAKEEALDMASLEKEARSEQIIDRSAGQESIENFVQQIKHEPIPRQMRLVLMNKLGDKLRFNELTQEIEVEGKPIKP